MASFELPDVAFLNASDVDSDRIAEALVSSGRLRVHTVKTTALRVPPGVERIACAVVNMDDLGEAEFEFLDRVHVAFPDAALVLVTDKLDDAQVRRLFKTRINDWLPRPLNVESLVATVKTQAYAATPDGNDVHVVLSAVGGAGGTTTALSLAGIAANARSRSGGRVALVDLDFSAADCGYKLNTVSDFDFTSLAATPERVDVELLDAIEQTHDDGFSVFSYHAPEMCDEPGAHELVLRMLDAVSAAYRTTIVDVPYYESSWTSAVLSGATSVTIVTEQSLPAVRHAVGRLRQISEGPEKTPELHVIVNKWQGGLFTTRVSKRRITKLFDGIDVTFAPDVTAIVGEAADRGILPTRVRAYNAYSRTLAKFAKTAQITR